MVNLGLVIYIIWKGRVIDLVVLCKNKFKKRKFYNCLEKNWINWL